MSDIPSDEPVLGVPLELASAAPKPRVWTVFLALVAAVVLATVFQAIAAFVLVAWSAAQGIDPLEAGEQILAKLVTPEMFMLMVGCAQLGFAVAVAIPVLLSPVPARERLGLVPVKVSKSIYPLAMLGSLTPLAFGFAIAYAMTSVLPGDLSVEALYEHITPVNALPFLLFVSLVPGVIEELLFRGYMQRRLLARWSPNWAIVVTSLVFAFVHVAPITVVALLPLSFWLGVVAWRSGSVLPTILCHAFVNGSLNGWRMVVKFVEVPENVQLAVVVASLLISLLGFIQSLRLLTVNHQARDEIALDAW